MAQKAGAVGQAHDATVTAVNGSSGTNGTGRDRSNDHAAALAAAASTVEKLRAHLAGAEAELARLRAEGTN